MNADSIKIECVEDGFHMIVTDDHLHPWHFRITDPEALYDHVKAAIGPWLRERDEAKREYETRRFLCDPDESGGYDTSDPKHPAFHSTHADIWDNRDKTAGLE